MLTIKPDLQALAETYNLPLPLRTAELDERVYRISTPSQEYALKVYRRGANLEPQRYEHWILEALRGQGLSFDLPYPVRDQRGATVHTAQNGDIWVLAPLLAGAEPISNDPDHAFAAGSALAELHIALAHLQPVQSPTWSDYHPDQRVRPILRGLLPTQPADLGLQDTPESHHRLRRFLRLVEGLRQAPPPPAWDVAWHIVHGDFFGPNLLYDGERVCGVLDFGVAHTDYRAREVAQTLTQVATDMGPIFWATARAFLDGYAERLTLNRAEIALIPRFLVEVQVERILAYSQSGQRAHAARALRTQEEISAWVEIEQSRLMGMLRGVFLGE